MQDENTVPNATYAAAARRLRESKRKEELITNPHTLGVRWATERASWTELKQIGEKACPETGTITERAESVLQHCQDEDDVSIEFVYWLRPDIRASRDAFYNTLSWWAVGPNRDELKEFLCGVIEVWDHVKNLVMTRS